MSETSGAGGGQGILSLAIRDKNALYSAYMSFVRNGGLFVATNRRYRIGDEVFILLTLMEDPEKIPVVGRVVWITPEGVQGNRTPGIGVQFTEGEGGPARNKIETYLAGALESDRPTHTM
ncbi:PilZ domain-containing protein [Arhodomonas sp. SL1]|uniref:PilZ domain-containing protein n=1 Tax=Arhodomonas sp. SL1 TaxID=3425691 RepID=UPI003F884F13